ncbi:hypothetical protein Salat_1853000 [Sesamum alatum]|uniref:Uncharacterized protein n=1 Tax=Sesamum alatum TaxID=300844 RepID=A0AAE2CHW0_9LAMI|nr:hypothetical protein Salat_1853000 [Sesamum alatum]
MYLGERKSGGEINGEIPSQIATRNEFRIGNQITSTENPSVGSNIGGAKFHGDVEDGEKIDGGSGEDEKAAPAVIHVQAFPIVLKTQEVEEERVDEKRSEGGDEEDAVPSVDEFTAGVEDLAPPYLLAVADKGAGDGESHNAEAEAVHGRTTT